MISPDNLHFFSLHFPKSRLIFVVNLRSMSSFGEDFNFTLQAFLENIWKINENFDLSNYCKLQIPRKTKTVWLLSMVSSLRSEACARKHTEHNSKTANSLVSIVAVEVYFETQSGKIFASPFILSRSKSCYQKTLKYINRICGDPDKTVLFPLNDHKIFLKYWCRDLSWKSDENLISVERLDKNFILGRKLQSIKTSFRNHLSTWIALLLKFARSQNYFFVFTKY